jgi:glycosyltransferase involved in cell wall biosynthesis
MTERKLKLVHVTSMHTWDDDRIFERACVGLAQLGYDSSLVSTAVAINKKSEEGILYEDGDQKGGVKLHWVKKRAGIRRRLFSSYDAMRRAVKLKPDVIHFHDPDLLPWAYYYSFFYKGAMVYDIHENYCVRIHHLSLPKGIKNMLANSFRGFEKMVIKRIAGFVTTTETMKTLYNGVPSPGIAVSNVPFLKRLAELPVAKEKEEQVTIITSGTNSEERNCLQTVEAIPMILKEFPDVKFKFVGKYQPESFENTLRERARELNVEHAVIIEGMLPWLKNFERVGRAHIGCVFYADNLNNRVTIPNRLFEYMAMGLTIVGEAFPEVEKVVTDAKCGITVDSSKPESIAKGICSLLRNPAELAQMGKNGEAAVKNKYNFENELKQLSGFYQKIAKQ